MTKYDSAVLQNYADRLYSQAAWVAVKYAILIGALFTALGFAGAGYANVALVHTNWDASSLQVPLAILGAVLGAAFGYGKSFQYRFQAQAALCQMQIEYNTRKAS